MGTHYSSFFLIDGTKIKIATGSYGEHTKGKTQTINVFDHSELEGNYQAIYRIDTDKDFVSESLLSDNAKNLHELDFFLISKRGAKKERPKF